MADKSFVVNNGCSEAAAWSQAAAGMVAVKQWQIPSRDVATYTESHLRISP